MTQSPSPHRTIFVTVGTTLFEALIDATTTSQALEWMVFRGYTHLIIQYGRGSKPTIPKNCVLQVESYAFKPTLLDDIQKADLILSHAGAGTVTEVLRLKKRLVVIINTALMGNHQTELANALGERQHLYVVESPEKLNDINTWNALESFVPIPQEDTGDQYDFPRLLDSFLGFASKQS